MFKYILAILTLVSFQLKAQTDTTTVGNVKDVQLNVKGNGKATVHYGKKIGDDPLFKDTVKVESDVAYNFIDKKVNSDFQVKEINAPKLKMMEPLDKLYKGYVALGFSDFKTPPYFEFNHSTIRNRHHNAGFTMSHNSQEQAIGDINNARYTNSNVSFFGKKFLKHKTWYGSADYDYNTFRYYGYNTDQIVDPEEESLVTGFSVLNANTGLKSSKKGKTRVGYDFNLAYDMLLQQEMLVAEHKVDFKSNLNWLMKTKAIDLLVDVDFGASYLNSGRVLSDHESTLFDVSLMFNKKNEKYDITVGLKGFFQTAQERKLWGFPFAEIDYSFVKDVLHAYARLSSNMERNSYLNYVDLNPFITNGEAITTTTTKQDFMGGLKGAFNSKSSFNIGLRYKNLEDLPLYYNVGDNGFNTFRILTDEVKHRQVFGEFMWDGKKLDFSLKGQYNIYDVFANEAFHLPNVYAEGGVSYNIQDKIKVGAEMFFYGEQLALESFDADNRPLTKTLDPIFDFNVNIKYNYNKRLGAFLRVNNILNTKHVRWDQYSNYGLNFLFGVGYSF